ncbi:hypothetical protein [Ralstonia solanacearum]|uniref:hypothetical protein n=1 Tax=Ralstonia solanacearum TaxID=305 RepID=UPI0001D93EAB|nr:hypothetical protein [Ralstonia solanacearum]CBJ44012.1 conserved protein of unknown function [Ralstonia solanacearum CFBP2957]
MTTYEAYKPLRNRIARLPLERSFEWLWALSQHLFNNAPLPQTILLPGGLPIKGNFHPWELTLLAREIVLHAAPSGTADLGRTRDLVDVINSIRRVDEAVAKEHLQPSQVFAELHRIAHRQFPLQQRRDPAVIMRYLKIFGERDVDAVLARETGLTIRQLYFMGLAVAGHLAKYPGINAHQDYSSFGIGAEPRATFFSKMGIDIKTLRERTRAAQHYDDRWAYTWNPLEATPLVALNPQAPHLLHCPIPALLLQRISRGVFYDLIKAVDFDNPYGRAYQAYVGMVIREVFAGRSLVLVDEEEYKVGRHIHHGVDWIFTDGSANVFVECKTKRLRHDAKVAIDGAVLDGQLAIMAEAVVQLYRNIEDALAGRTNWRPNGLPVYPLVATLEDWCLFSPVMVERLETMIRNRLADAGVDERVLETMPYTIASIEEFEIAGQAIARTGIQRFFSCKTSVEHRSVMLLPFVHWRFSDALESATNLLFKQDWERFLPEIANLQ